MKLLLDTNIAFWSVANLTKLGTTAREMIEEPASDVFVSVVSIWEIAIKHPLQRGSVNDMPIPGRKARALFEEAGYTILPITAAHTAAIDDLPPLHGDPFDRMLIAQALSEPMRLLTRDARLKAYSELVTAA